MRGRICRSVFGLTFFGVTLFGLALAACAGFSAANAQATKPAEPAMEHAVPAKPSTSLTISYAGKTKTWSPQDLAAKPQHAVDVYNAHSKAQEHYAGVPLIDLLAEVGVPVKPRGKDFRLYLVAEGTDGYQVVFSLGEVSPEVHDGTVIVADTMGAAPLGSNGAFQLVVTGEKRPARWVRNLVKIRVLEAQ